MKIRLRDTLSLAVPLAAALGALMLGGYYIAPGVDVGALARGIVGPATWPRTMLYCVAACALALFLRNTGSMLSAGGAAAPAADEPAYHEGKALAAVAVLVAYCIGIPEIGFPWATLGFIAGWLLLGGVRRPLVVVLCSGLGTVALIYLFVKVSLMPLDRGRGVFEQATVGLYRLLGVY